MKNCPSAGLAIGLAAMTVIVARVTSPDAAMATPPAVMVISTVLPVGSPASSVQVATPGLRAPQLWKTSVPGSSVAQLGDVHASLTVVVPNNVAGTGSTFGGTVFVLVLLIFTSSVITSPIESSESLGTIGFDPLACTPA